MLRHSRFACGNVGSTSRASLVAVLWSLMALFGSSVGAAEPTALVTDTAGAQFALTKITLSLNLKMGKAEATVYSSHVAEIVKLDGEEKLWQVSLVDAPPLRGEISGRVAGEWVLGAYQSDLADVAKLSFPEKSAADSWPENPETPVAARLVLKGDVSIQASEIQPVFRYSREYAYGGRWWRAIRR